MFGKNPWLPNPETGDGHRLAAQVGLEAAAEVDGGWSLSMGWRPTAAVEGWEMEEGAVTPAAARAEAGMVPEPVAAMIEDSAC